MVPRNDRQRRSSVGAAWPVLWAALGVLIGWIGHQRSGRPRGRVAPITYAAPADVAPAAHPAALRAGPATATDRRVVIAQPLAILALATTLVLPDPVRVWAATLVVMLWALAGLTFVASIAGKLVRRLLRARRRSRVSARLRACRSRVAAWWRSVPDIVARTPVTWPFLMLSGPATAAFAFELLPRDVAVALFAGAVMAGLPIQLIVSGREVLRELNAHASLTALAGTILLWIGLAAVVAFEFGWPAPSDTGYFATAAEINATLLIAGVINAAPAAWRITPRIRLTWILTAPIIAVIGLGASIAGAISTRGSAVLFILSVSALAPIVVAVVLGAHDQVAVRRHAAGHRPDMPAGSQSGEGR